MNQEEPMDVSIPISAANRHEGLLDRVSVFIAAAQSAAADGLTWVEFGELLLSLLRLVVTALDTVSRLTGPEKKGLAMDAVAALFDAVADKAVPVLAWPIWIVARPAVRSLVLSLASGAIEQLIPLVRA
jgi:hypothetical protein